MIKNDKNSLRTTEKRLGILLHTGFFLIGILTVLLGQILPFLTAKLSLNDAQAGYFFVAQFTGSLTGAFVYNRVIKKIGYLKMLFGSFVLMAFGCAGLNLDSQFLSLTAVCVYGFGLGTAIPAINLLVIEINREKSSAASNLINFSWGIGAISAKPFTDFTGSADSIFQPTLLLSFSLAAIGTAILFSRYRENTNVETLDFDSLKTKIWTQPTAWLIAVFSFVQVGIESSVAGWLTTYEIRLTQIDFSRLISAALVYFLLLIIGRGVMPLFYRVWNETIVMFASLFVMTAGIVIILMSENFFPLMVGAALLGFGTSSVFPMNLARFTKFFGKDATKNAAPLFVMGSLGSAFTTWFIGFVSNYFNSLRAGFSVVLFSCLLLIFLQIVLSKKLSGSVKTEVSLN